MKCCLRVCFLAIAVFFLYDVSAQGLWSEAPQQVKNDLKLRSNSILPDQFQVFNVNPVKLINIQASTPFMRNDGQTSGSSFEMPLPSGDIISTSIIETSIWSDQTVADAIGLKTYILINPTTKVSEGRITVRNNEVNGAMFTTEGTVYISSVPGNTTNAHMVYYTKDAKGGDLVPCMVDGNLGAAVPAGDQVYYRTTAGDCKKRIFRIAIAATGEYTASAGGVANALARITTTMNIVNAIYLRDVNVEFNIVSNANTVYTNAATDPYGTNASAALNENQTNLDAVIGSSNYDVGLVFSAGWGGGVAQLQSVCGPNKGRGAVGSSTPYDQWFNGATAHELGHMFGATHTFSGTNGACGSNISLSSSWEPGSGSTIMAYAAAGCGVTNSIQSLQDHYFHGGSIGQMQNFILAGATCVTGVTTANQAPTATVAGTTYNIPVRTPFMLTLNSTDPNGDALTYNWEQMDAHNTGTASPPSSTSTVGPLFRSFPPTSESTRYFPRLQTLLSGVSGSTYEVLPAATRVLTFRGTVRDNSALGSCTAEANVTLNANSTAGPFMITSQWASETWLANGSNTATVTWDVANTTAAPINCTNVNILLSVDGGFTYPIVLANSVPNNGSRTFTIPSVNTTQGRIMVKASNNVFFNINDAFITVQVVAPVTFLGLNARKDGDKVAIDWSTATEQNTEKFIVERSANGVEFNSEVGVVRANGNSSTTQQYQLVDNTPFNRWNYYRVKAVDFDGKTSYSNIASVYFDKSSGFSVSIYPNPVRNEANVEFFSYGAGKVHLDIYDSKGALISRKTISSINGVNKTSLNTSNLAKGIYVLKCISDQESIAVIKLVKE